MTAKLHSVPRETVILENQIKEANKLINCQKTSLTVNTTQKARALMDIIKKNYAMQHAPHFLATPGKTLTATQVEQRQRLAAALEAAGSAVVTLDKKFNLNPTKFVNSIKQGNVDQVIKFISEGMAVNSPLPNGEMPLHLAVREGKQNVVVALLKQGADLGIKDFQGLTAIDHAVLMKNELVLATILEQKFGKTIKEIQEQIKCKGSISHINQVKNEIQRASTFFDSDVQNLIPTAAGRAAYLGDLNELSTLSAETVNEPDVKGLTPIHYAILGRQSAAVEKLIELGADINTRCVWFAVISGSIQILNKLISLKVDLNPKGLTPLHYACAKEDWAAIEALVKAGADPTLLDHKEMSALALIGASAFQRDPLSLPKTQILLFATTCLYWLSTMASAGGWATSDQAQLIVSFLLLGSGIGVRLSEYILAANATRPWNKSIEWASRFINLGTWLDLFGILPFNDGRLFEVLRQAWITCHVGYSVFKGLKNCWKNIGYRNWAVVRNAIVYGVNTVYSTHELRYQIKNSRYGYSTNSQNVKQCAEIKPSILTGLSTAERVLKPELDPKCPEHALMMMSPDLTMKALGEQGTSLYKKAYRQMMLEFHPDKAGSSERVKEVAARINAAGDTLKKCVQENCWATPQTA